MLTVQEKIRLLMWDRRYLIIPQDIPTPNGIRAVIMRDPTVGDWNYFLYIRRLEEQANIFANVPSENDVFKAARTAGYWTEEDDRIQKDADDHIKFLESEIATQKFSSRRKLLERQLSETKKLRNEVLLRANNLKTQTAEHLAHEVSVFSLLMRVVLTLDGQQFWPTEETFLKHKQYFTEFIIFLAHHLLTESTWETRELREVARNAEWRLLWSLNKENIHSLFNRPPSDLNLNQKLLIYWSRVYDIAFESAERPTDDIIDDDDKYDAWLANRDLANKEKKNNDKMKKASNHHEQGTMLEGEFIESCTCGVGAQRNVGLGLKKPHTNNCQFGYFRKYTTEEKVQISKQVYGRNSNSIREYINKEHDKVDKNGMVEEQHLRGRKSRILLGSDSKIFKKKK